MAFKLPKLLRNNSLILKAEFTELYFEDIRPAGVIDD